jgi:hypothetical protein
MMKEGGRKVVIQGIRGFKSDSGRSRFSILGLKQEAGGRYLLVVAMIVT